MRDGICAIWKSAVMASTKPQIVVDIPESKRAHRSPDRRYFSIFLACRGGEHLVQLASTSNLPKLDKPTRLSSSRDCER